MYLVLYCNIQSSLWVFLLSRQWGTATLPHELMAANAEMATKPVKKKVDKNEQRKKDDESKAQGLCYTWNRSNTRGKCKFEAENDGKKCNKQHYCSWCKSELGQTNFHQRTFCKKREDKESE